MDGVSIEDYTDKYPPGSIAIVGVACRYPEADNVDEFWSLLESGRSTAREAPERMGLKEHSRIEGRKFFGNFINDPDAFDHRFFKKSSREAAAWDPQVRILLEVVYQALESAGHYGQEEKGKNDDYGCYISAIANNYYDNINGHAPNAFSFIGSSRSFYSGRISHQLGLTGPSVTIDTACSAGLVAIHMACQAIRAGECTRAIAAGTNVLTSPYDFENLAAATFLSPTGQSKPFDARGDGYCRGEGVAAVVLKSVEAALAENDNILGVIVGTAMSQISNEAHITVPSAKSQHKLYNKVLRKARIDPNEVTYMEAHGTGTPVGDPIECESLRATFGTGKRTQTLHFGSHKSQIGHTESSAGFAGLIKVLLMMEHRRILPQAQLQTLNSKIPIEEMNALMLELPRSARPWLSQSPVLTACVSGYGAAGSNAALALRQAPPTAKDLKGSKGIARFEKQPLFIAAASPASLAEYAKKLLQWFQRKDIGDEASRASLASDILFTLATRQNRSLQYFAAETVTDVSHFEETLSKIAKGGLGTKKDGLAASSHHIVLAFGGQERDYIGLSKEAYENTALLRHHLDECDKAYHQLSSSSIFPAVFTGENEDVRHLPTLHAALFAVQYANAKCWVDAGVSPAAVIGHSFGQFAALAISGALSIVDAMKLVVSRAKLINKLWGSEPGAMLSVLADSATVDRLLQAINLPTLEMACRNHPTGHTIVGSGEEIDELEKYISTDSKLSKDVRFKRLRVTNGFHSVFTEPILAGIKVVAETCQWNKPSIHIELCRERDDEKLPGAWLVPEHTRTAVYFADAVSRLSQKLGNCVWLEAGMKTSITSLIRSNFKGKSDSQYYLQSALGSTPNDIGALASQTVQLWNAGFDVQFWPYHTLQKSAYNALLLPPYQFEKTRHWMPFHRNAIANAGEPTKASISTAPTASAAPVPASSPVSKLMPPEVFCVLADTKENTSVFVTDPESPRFKMLVQRHIVFGQALAPLACYWELPSRAALTLVPGASYRTHVSHLEAMEVRNPVGLDWNRIVLLTMTRSSPKENAWSFTVSSQTKMEGKNPTIHCTGRFRLQERNDANLTQTMGTFQCQTNYQRCLSLLASEDVEKLQGAAQVYRASYPMFDYKEEMFRGIKSICAVGNESVGRVRVRAHTDIHPESSLYDAAVLDCMMQNSAILVNTFLNQNRSIVYVCIGNERTITGPGFDVRAGNWVVHSVVTLRTEDHVECDAYIYEEKTEQLVMAFLGFHFKKTPVSIWASKMQGANESKTLGHRRTANRNKSVSIPLTPEVNGLTNGLYAARRPSLPQSLLFQEPFGMSAEPTVNGNHAPAKSPETNDMNGAYGANVVNGVNGDATGGKAALLKVLHQVTDTPIEEMLDDSAPEDIGIDSLMANEVLKEINIAFSANMQLDTFLSCQTIQALAEAIGI